MYGVAFLWMIPILWMVDTAFKPDDEIFSSPPKWIPSHFTLDHVKEVIMEWPFLKWLLQSVIVATTVTFGSLIVSTLAAYSFARLQWRGRDFLFIFFLIFMLLPFELNVIPLFFQMSKFGWLNTVPGVALPMIAMPIGSAFFCCANFLSTSPVSLKMQPGLTVARASVSYGKLLFRFPNRCSELLGCLCSIWPGTNFSGRLFASRKVTFSPCR
jgi:ABC-type glycerol-3-phosphate transport system permease component